MVVKVLNFIIGAIGAVTGILALRLHAKSARENRERARQEDNERNEELALIDHLRKKGRSERLTDQNLGVASRLLGKGQIEVFSEGADRVWFVLKGTR